MKVLRFVSVMLVVALAAAAARAQEPAEPETTLDDRTQLASFRVEHDHAIGSGPGHLRILADGIVYDGDGEHEARDSRSWTDAEIKRLDIDRDRIVVVAYEAGRIPVLPRQLPWVDETKAIRTGSERHFRFKLVDATVTPEVVEALLARFPRPVATTVVAPVDESLGRLLFEVPVFHRHVTGGEHGMLRAFEHRLVFETDREGHSRQWRYQDVRDIGSLGRFRFEVATYESKRFTDGKSYIFDLKEPLRAADYDALWRRVYERDTETYPR